MSHLGDLLDLPEGSRLTGVTLHDDVIGPWPRWMAAHLQVVLLPKTTEPSASTGALTVFLPEVFASLHGTSPDGGSWAAFLLLPRDDRQVIPHDKIALAPLRRALGLLGMEGASARSVPLTERALQRMYWQTDTPDADGWPAEEMLLGLIVELTGVPLTQAVEFADRGSVDAGPAIPRQRLVSLLESWSAG